MQLCWMSNKHSEAFPLKKSVVHALWLVDLHIIKSHNLKGHSSPNFMKKKQDVRKKTPNKDQLSTNNKQKPKK